MFYALDAQGNMLDDNGLVVFPREAVSQWLRAMQQYPDQQSNKGTLEFSRSYIAGGAQASRRGVAPLQAAQPRLSSLGDFDALAGSVA